MTALERDYNFRDRETHECFNTKLKKNCYKNCNSFPLAFLMLVLFLHEQINILN